MRQDFRIVGTGGQGVISLAMLLATAYGLYEGHEVTQTQSYGAEARGGACQAGVIVSDSPIGYIKVDNISVFIAFGEAGFRKFAHEIRPDTIVFIDSSLINMEEAKKYSNNVYSIPATDIATKKFKPFMANIVMMGYVASKLDNLNLSSCEDAIRREMPKKFIDLNISALKYGYEYYQEVTNLGCK